MPFFIKLQDEEVTQVSKYVHACGAFVMRDWRGVLRLLLRGVMRDVRDVVRGVDV